MLSFTLASATSPVPSGDIQEPNDSAFLTARLLSFDKRPRGVSHFHESLIFKALLGMMKETPSIICCRAVSSLQTPAEAKTYSRTKLLLGIASSAFSFLLVLVLVLTGSTNAIAALARSVTSQKHLALLIFAAIFGALSELVTLPLSYYSGFVVEHRFRLSNQTLGRWAWENLKGLLVGLPIGIALLLLLYTCLEVFGIHWWLPVAAALTCLSILFARLGPVLIFPLFYRPTPLDRMPLKERILQLATNAGMRIDGVFSFDLSKNTQKANALFTGIGKAKRVLLGDTLLRSFEEQEVETVFAHELGHYSKHHIGKGILLGVVLTFSGLFFTARLHAWSLSYLGFSSLTDLGALPLVALWLSVFGVVTGPIENAIARYHERQADRYAVRATGNGPAFISALKKIATMNLADPDPHPAVEFLFYSHPSIARRVRDVEATRA
jgi:STE24 endopeptidase